MGKDMIEEKGMKKLDDNVLEKVGGGFDLRNDRRLRFPKELISWQEGKGLFDPEEGLDKEKF